MLGASPLLGQALQHAWDVPALGAGSSKCLGYARSWDRPFNMLACVTGSAKHLPFVLQSDVDHVVLVKNGADGKQTKEITTVSGAIFAGLDNGLLDLGMNYVQLDPMKRWSRGGKYQYSAASM